MTYPVLCPKCDSDEIEETLEGDLECQSCGFHFDPDNNPNQLVELKKHTALLRKIITLLEKHLSRTRT